MARISEDLIREIYDANDIVDYVSERVRLKKAGKDYMGLCPFHHEKTPSFHVSQDKQLFHCFGCGASGNLVQYVMRTENLDFIDAVRLMADRAGIMIPEDSAQDDRLHSKRKRMLEMNKVAARFFFERLKDKRTGIEAQRYLNSRHISWKTVTVYGLGYAPGTRTALIEHLQKAGYSGKEAVEAGLAIERDGRIIDKFRNRVMFPIINVRGNVIGFGGRIMSNEKEINGYKIPKYLNTSETLVFDKGKNLFSLNIAKNSKSDSLILCEGYMDVISPYQAGIDNIVATLGTAITEDQAKLMKRYANEILICYDMDEAGRKAALRAIDIINSVNGKSKVMKLSGAKDPDEYINKNGVQAFRNAMKNAVPSTEFKLSLIKGKYDTSETDGKIKFINEAARSLAGISDPVEVDAYVRKIAEENDISKDAVYSALKVGMESGKRRIYSGAYSKKIPTRNIKEEVPKALIEAEKRLLALISSKKNLYRIAAGEIKPEEYSTAVYRRLAGMIYDVYERGESVDAPVILNEFADNTADADEAAAVFYNNEVYDADEKTVRDLIVKIKLEKIELQIKNETDSSRISELVKERNYLKK